MPRINASKVNLILILLSLTFSCSCYGIGLGDLKVYSYLDEPLVAEILVNNLGGIDPNRLVVGLADAKDFSRAGMDRPYFLTNLAFDIVTYQEKVLIYIRSLKPVKTPYLEFLIEVSWPDGSLIKDYTALIDPPPTNLNSATRAKALSQLAIAEAEKKSFGGGDAIQSQLDAQEVESLPNTVLQKPRPTTKKSFSDETIDFTEPAGPIELVPAVVPDIDQAPTKPAAPTPIPAPAPNATTPVVPLPPAPNPTAPAAPTANAPAPGVPATTVPAPSPATPSVPPASEPSTSRAPVEKKPQGLLDMAINQIRTADQELKPDINLEQFTKDREQHLAQPSPQAEQAQQTTASPATQSAPQAVAATAPAPVRRAVTLASQPELATPASNNNLLLIMIVSLVALAAGLAFLVKRRLGAKKQLQQDHAAPIKQPEIAESDDLDEFADLDSVDISDLREPIINDPESEEIELTPVADTMQPTQDLNKFEDELTNTDLDNILQTSNIGANVEVVDSEDISSETARVPVSIDAETIKMKIDLAKQYLEAGDKESAKTTLQEVIAVAKDEQKIEAELLLSSII